MLTPEQLLRLGRIYSLAAGIPLSAVGKKACQNNRVFHRLSEGFGANSRTLERLERFFYREWPDGAAWPPDIPYEPPAASPLAPIRLTPTANCIEQT